MKKYSRREALRLIGLTTVGGALAACAPQTVVVEPTATSAAQAAATATPQSAAPPPEPEVIEIKVSLWDIQNSFPEGEPDEIAQFVSDKFRVKLTPVNVGWGDANEKYNTWAASGQLPDIIGAIAMPGTGRYYQWIGDGVVRPLPDVSSYPEINKLMGLPEVKAFTVDGQDYFLPRSTYSDPAWWAMDRGLIARKDWMEKLGVSDPKTEQDYIDLTVAFAESDPDGNGADDTTGFTPVAPWILISQGWTGFGYTDWPWMRDPDGKYRQACSGERTFTMMQFFKRMYQAGGLDPDFATQESGQALDNFGAGKVGILGRQVSPKHIKAVMDSWVLLQPDKDFVESIAILHGPTVDGSYTRFAEKAFWSESYIEANVDDAKMERILQLYNWLYSEDGLYMMQYGIDGKDYTVESGNVELLTPINSETGLHTPTSELYPFTYAMSYLAAWSGDLLQYKDPSIPQSIRDLCAAERDYRVSNWKDPEVNWAVQAIDVPEKQEMAAVQFTDDWVRFIMDTSGQSDQALYDTMKENWDANGYAAAIDAITEKAQELGIE
jgi:putative aldouronate transport system substrate-binding protein